MSQSSLFWIYLPRWVLLICRFQFSSYFLKVSLDYGLIFSSVPLISSAVNLVINTLGLPLPILYFKDFLSEAFHFFHLIFILLVVFLSFISAPYISVHSLARACYVCLCPTFWDSTGLGVCLPQVPCAPVTALLRLNCGTSL